VWIDYDGRNNLLEVFLSLTSIKPANPLLSTSVELLNLGSQAFVGFSGAASSGTAAKIDILNWELSYENPDPLINPVYRFFNTVAGGHFFTTSPSERDFVLNNLPQYVFEGVGFEASVVDGPDLVPIYRFFNTVAGGHFFTASETERNFVLNNLPQFIDEGIGFYAYGADTNLGADVFRFFNTVRVKQAVRPLL
jgi:hypothetical protein